MNRFQRLRTSLVLFIMAIMLVSCTIPTIVLLILKMLGFFEGYIHWAPIILACTMLGISVVVGSLLSFLVAKRFLKPLDELIEANKKIAQGDFSVRIEEDPDQIGEIHELLHSFNRMADELQSIEFYRSDFINNFSHEFKTPIISVRGFAKQLKNQDLSEEQKREYIDIIINESEKLCNMTANVLQMSKLDNQTMVCDKVLFSLDEQIRNVILLLERQWSKKNIQWQLEMPIAEYCGNQDLIALVWKNLLENAIKFVDSGGTIRVEISVSEAHATVKIADNGCGMSPETQAHIFEKFYQGDTSHAKEGNGLGLSIVRRILELCEGKITVASVLGEGTTFTVILPIVYEKAVKEH